MTAKYKLDRAELVRHPLRNVYIDAYRVIALIDIPRHGVKAGDIGGYVDHKKVLSQKGDCWIADDAFALDKSIVRDNAIIKDNAVVSATLVINNAAIYGSARVFEMPGAKKSQVTDSARIYGEAQVISSQVKDYSKIYDAALVNGAFILDYSEIFGHAKLMGPGIYIDNSRVFGYAEIHSADILNSTIHCQVHVHKFSAVEDSILTHTRVVKEGVHVSGVDMTLAFRRANSGMADCVINGVKMATCANVYHDKPSRPTETSGEAQSSQTDARKRLDAIENKYAEYETDIVKIIKYPIMTDLTNSYTATFNSALRKTQRFFDEGDMTAYKDSLDTLEDAFHIAESNARKISLSQLLPDERSKVTDARQMLALALDESSSETEKKNAFKGAMRNLEGIVAVPDVAMTSLRQQIGLLEIEA